MKELFKKYVAWTETPSGKVFDVCIDVTLIVLLLANIIL